MKKAQWDLLKGLAMNVAIAGILTAVIVYVVEQIQNQLSGSATYVTGNTTSGLSTIATWMPIIVIAGIAGVVIWFVIAAMGGGGSKGQMNLKNLVMGLGTTGILVAIATYVVTQIQPKLTSNLATNVTSNVTSALVSFGSWLPILAIAGVAGVVIYLVISSIAGKEEGQ